MNLNRRGFLKASLSTMALFTLEATVPNWIARSANAMCAGDCLNGDRILVIIQLAGGNDGLNTIIPSTDPNYHAMRPNIGIARSAAITLDAANSLHPAMAPLADWYQRGLFATVQNVGYVNPNLSHFTSMQYFEEGYVPGQPRTRKGWAAKVYDSTCGCGLPDESLFYMGSGVRRIPSTFAGSDCYTPPAVASAEDYRLRGDRDEPARLAAIENLNRIPTIDPVIDFLQRSEQMLEASIDEVAIAHALPTLVPDDWYSADGLGNGLRMASKVIRAGFKTRIFYVSQGGYDTHANQVLPVRPTELGNHPRLLGNLANSINAFLTEMEASGNLDRVMVMTFSEFGRRVEENSSLGTDHGAANSMMVWGGQVAGGIYGGQPNLGNLQRGNLRHDIDFRSVYANIIQNWLLCDPRGVFGNQTYDDIIAPDILKMPFVVNQTSARPSLWGAYH